MSDPQVSIILPTYNESKNIHVVLRALKDAMQGFPYEAVVVDDDSPDGTADAARAADPDAQVVVRTQDRGLATAVVEGFRRARAPRALVMDADMQHPVTAVRDMAEKAVAEDADLVVGSRYVDGGDDGSFSFLRRTMSKGAAFLGRLALPPVRRFRITDPMSGLFLVRLDRVDLDVLEPKGYKILLEVLAKARLEKVAEVGYAFGTRTAGESKLGTAVILQYLTHLAALAFGHPENRRAASFATVGASGVGVNLGLLWILHGRLGLHDLLAVPIAVEASILWNFLWNDAITFRDRRHDHVFGRMLRFNAVSLLALGINLATYAALQRGLGLHYLLAEAIAILVAFGANYAGNMRWTYGGTERFRLREALRKRSTRR